MSIDQRKILAEGAMWLFRISLGAIAWFAVETFQGVQTEIRDLKNDVQGEIHDLRREVQDVGKDVGNVKERVSRIEGKIEQR